MIGENYIKQIIFSLKHWVNNNFVLKENLEAITNDTIDAICGASVVAKSKVTF